MSRVLVVEDSLEVRASLVRSLELDGYEVRYAGRAAEAISVFVSWRPDMLVLDLGLPDRDGYQVLKAVRDRGSHCPVLILSARNMEADKVEGFRLGADDYVTKPFSVMELLARIAAQLRRSGWAAARPDEDSGRAVNLTDEELRARFGLTARQIVVARLLGEGCSNAEIADRLSVSYFTARNHAEQVLAKLGVPSRAAVGAILFGGAEPHPASRRRARHPAPPMSSKPSSI